MNEERLFHPESPGSPYTRDDAVYDIDETKSHLWTIQRRARDHADISSDLIAVDRKLARVRRFLEEQVLTQMTSDRSE